LSPSRYYSISSCKNLSAVLCSPLMTSVHSILCILRKTEIASMYARVSCSITEFRRAEKLILLCWFHLFWRTLHLHIQKTENRVLSVGTRFIASKGGCRGLPASSIRSPPSGTR